MSYNYYIPQANYSGPTSLANRLHAYPHYDFKRNQVEVSPQSVIDNWRPYAESLASIALLPILLFIIFVIGDIIIRCIFACRQPRHDEISATYKPREYRICGKYQPYWDRKWAISMILAFCTLIIIFVALGELGSVNKDMNRIQDAMYDAQAYQDRVLFDGRRGQQLTNDVQRLLNELGTPLDQSGTPTYSSFPAQIRPELLKMNTPINDAKQVLASFVRDSDSYRFAGDIIKYTDQGRDALRAVMITVFILFFFTFVPLLLIRTFFATKRTFLNFIQILAIIACLISWAAAMVMIATSVGVADICQDPNAYIRYYFKKDKFSDNVRQVIDYFIMCPLSPAAIESLRQGRTPADYPNPFDNPVFNSGNNPLYRYLKQGDEAVTSIGNILNSPDINTIKPNLPPNIRNFLEDAIRTNNDARIFMRETLVDVSCMRLNNDYTTAVNTVCKDLLEHWYGVAVCLALSTLFYCVVRCFIRSRQRIVTGDVEGAGASYAKYESPQGAIIVEISQPPQQQHHGSIAMATPIMVEATPASVASSPISDAPPAYSSPLEPAPSTSFQQPLNPPSNQQLVAPSTFSEPLSESPVGGAPLLQASAPPALEEGRRSH